MTLLIWWTNQDECERIMLDKDHATGWPSYLRSEFRSRLGRAGRGRLWVDNRFGAASVEWSDDKPMCRMANDSGGIVIDANDLKHVATLPGFVTTLAMERAPLS